MNQQIINSLFLNSRVLIVKDGCPKCMKWKKFIERINAEVKLDKRIKIIDATKFEQIGFTDDPLLKIFEPYYEGYPTLFFNGVKLMGANSQIELEAYINAALRNDFIVPKNNRFIFDKECKRINKSIVCESN